MTPRMNGDPRCCICGGVLGDTLLDLGRLPISSHFRGGLRDAIGTHAFALVQCDGCGTLQQRYAPASELLRPPVVRVTYREPERHLDRTADLLASLIASEERPTVAGVSYKDVTLLANLQKRGITQNWRIDLMLDMGMGDPRAGNETLQALCTPDCASMLVAKHGRPTLVLARHIFEHTSDPLTFLAFLRELVGPGGYVMVEVPDCSRQLALLDYTMVWEDHRIYLTEDTLEGALRLAGLVTLQRTRELYAHEDCLTLVARVDGPGHTVCLEETTLAAHKNLVRRYASSFLERREAIRGYISRQRKLGGIALFGAGHLACTFVHLFGLSDFLDFVVDDDPNKQGLYLPGTDLSIRPSWTLNAGEIRLCLLAVNLESEDYVLDAMAAFVRGGGIFESIFPASSRAIPV